MDDEWLTARMIAGLVAIFPGTSMFISRFVGLVPKFVTRVRAPLTVATAVQTRREPEKRMLMEDFLSLELSVSYKRRDLQDIYHFFAQNDRRTDLP